MKRTIIAATIAALPILLCVSAVHAEQPDAGTIIDASKIPESGPLVVGGSGQTTGPNSKNQAISPIPGMQEEELSEKPPATTLTTPDVYPVTRNPARAPAPKH